MNTVILGLGAGGSLPSNIPIIDKVNVVGGVFTIVAGITGGSVNNKLGPKFTLMLGVSGYPLYIGAMWSVLFYLIDLVKLKEFENRWLDSGRTAAFAYFAAVFHGVCAGLFYTTIGLYLMVDVYCFRTLGLFIQDLLLQATLLNNIGANTLR